MENWFRRIKKNLSKQNRIVPITVKSMSPRRRSPYTSPGVRISPARSHSPNIRSSSLKRRSFSPNRKSFSPKRKSLSPKRKSFSPKRKNSSPNRKSLSPKRKSSSPKRKSCIYCGNNLLSPLLQANGGDCVIGTNYKCLKKGIGYGINSPIDLEFINYEPIDQPENIYCGNNIQLPIRYERFGRRSSCLRKGVGVGKRIKIKREGL